MAGVGPLYRRVFHGLRTEGAGTGREAAAIGLGIFIGCLPLYGFHLMLCWGVGWLLKLNRLKLYLAAQLSNPLFAPTLVFVEIQIGAWLRRGSVHELSLNTARTTNLSVFGVDALVGSLLVGGALGIAMAAATYAMSHALSDDEAAQNVNYAVKIGYVRNLLEGLPDLGGHRPASQAPNAIGASPDLQGAVFLIFASHAPTPR